jgi:hypothetical protein
MAVHYQSKANAFETILVHIVATWLIYFDYPALSGINLLAFACSVIAKDMIVWHPSPNGRTPIGPLTCWTQIANLPS